MSDSSSFTVGPVVLKSVDKSRMYDLLSDVFEFEVLPDQDLIYNGAFPIKIESSQARSSHTGESEKEFITFQFQCRDLFKIKEIVQKFEFFCYRKESKKDHAPKEKLVHLTIDEESSFGDVSISDIDGRLWNFKTNVIH